MDAMIQTGTRFFELVKGMRVSGVTRGVEFSGVVTDSWTDSEMEGTKIATIRLIPRCSGEGLPIFENNFPAPYNRSFRLYHSDMWHGNTTIDQEYAVRF
jgi:hypothetical protein